MNNIFVVQNFQGEKYLRGIVLNKFVRHPIFSHWQFIYEFSKTSPARILKHVVQIGIILEGEKLLDDVGVLQLLKQVSLPEHAFHFLMLNYKKACLITFMMWYLSRTLIA